MDYLHKRTKSGINYIDIGKGDSIVFIHGRSLDLRMWEPQIEYFSKSHRVIAYDLRGFGKSNLPDKPYYRSDDLKELLDELNIKNASIVGFSLGGVVAIEFALRYQKYCRQLILVSSDVSGSKFTSSTQKLFDEVSEIAKNDPIQAKKKWLNLPLFNYIHSNKEYSYLLKRIIEDYSGWHWINTDLRLKIEGKSDLERLSEIKIPTFILYGRKDLEEFLNLAHKINQEITSSKIYEFSSGHMINLENSERFNQILENILRL